MNFPPWEAITHFRPTIVGESETGTGDIEATAWTTTGGPIGLGSLGGNSYAGGVSADGAMIAGSSISDATDFFEAFRWTVDSGMVGLGTLGGGNSTAATGDCVSDDGSVIIGTSRNSIGQNEAYVWTVETGMLGIGSLGGNDTIATAVSADGSTVVGWSSNGTAQDAFVWTAAGGMQGLGTLGNGSSRALAVSADGSVIVGRSARDGDKAFVWTAETGMVELASLPGAGRTSAEGMSPDGTIIVGHSGGQGVLWRGSERELTTVSSMITDEYGIDISGWDIDWPSAVSADNGVIVGSGTNPSGDYVGWVFVISKDPLAMLEALIMDVAAINLQNGIANSLDSKLDAAIAAFSAENAVRRADAVNTLAAFINSVEAQRGGKISEADADYLITAAQEIIDLIE